MVRSRLVMVLVTALAMVGAVSAPGASAHDTGEEHEHRFRALVFSKVTNFYHSSIPAGQALIEQLGAEHDFDVVVSDDSTMFNDEDLAQFDVVVFNNTNSTPQSGDLLNADQRAAFQRYIQSGGGFAGLHAATAAERDWQWYEGLVGSIFTNHPPGQNPDGTIDGRVKVTDRSHPSTRNLPELWEYEEEWYNWNQRVVGDTHVLTWVDTKVGIEGLTEGPNHPFSWCQNYDGGRSWYTAGGHSPAAFDDADFVAHVLGGIEWAAGVAPGDCGATAENSFDKVLVADNPSDPMALDFLSKDELIFVERGGAVKIVDQTDLSTTVAAELDVYTPDSDGLLGIAVDPAFAENRWIYLMYSHPTEARMQISRFTLGADNLLDMASEEVLLEIPTYRGLDRSGVHMGGILKFDAQGNLYAGIGDNIDPFASDGYAPIDEREGRAHFDAQSTSANTADLRGKVLRITPQPDGTYTVPDDNLFTSGEWDHLFPGDSYDEQLARPEIYAMGFRNPFRFTVDQETGALMVADHSSDARNDSAARGPQAHGKWARVTEASNFGWPYCFGAELPFVDYDFATGESGEAFDCAGGPVNDSPHNTGLEQLPAVAVPDMVQQYGETTEWPELGTGGIAPVGGPVYDYDPGLDSDTKFPEHYDGKWFVAEWDRRWIKTVSFLSQDQSFERYPDQPAGYPYSVDPWGIDQTWVRPMDMEFGPDGALYVIEWGSNFGGNLRGQPNDDSGIYRIDYVAGDRPPTAKAEATPDNGQAPLEVRFSSEGTRHPAGNPITLHWDFGDGNTSTAANPTHTYTETGEYTARLTVTDDEDRTAIAVVDVVVGNSRPEVTMEMPPSGGFFDFGDTVPYDVSVTDAEDGSIADGGIDCGRVELLTLLGHDGHAHPLDSFQGCSGSVPTLTDGGHGEDQNLYYVFEGIYVDEGGDGVGTLTGAAEARLRTKHAEAEHFDRGQGVTVLDRAGASAGARIGEIRPGDWFALDPVNLRGIDSVTVGASSAGQGGHVEFRRDAPDGELLGSVQVNSNGSWDEVQELPVELTDPGATFELYVVFAGLDDYTGGGPDLLSVDWLRFNGAGVSDATAPQVTVTADPQNGAAPLDVSFSGTATSPLGHEIVSYDWDFGDGSASVTDGAAAEHTYTEPGEYRAVLTATDSAGNDGSGAVTVTVTEADTGEPPVCYGPMSDEFDGDALDRDRWSTIVREDPDAYSIGGGSLTLPTVAGRLYSTQNNDGTNIVLQPMPDGEWEATTEVTVDAGHQYQKAGLIVYGDDDNYARANIVGLGSPPDGTPGRKFEFIHETGGTPRNATGDSSAELPADFPTTFQLKVSSDGEQLTAAYSTDGETWEAFGRPAPLSTMTDPKVGLISNKSHTTAEVVDAAFDWFHVTPDAPAVQPEPGDEFDGNELDGCRWDRIVGHDASAYDLVDGRLQVDTTSGGNYGANNEPAVENQFLQSVGPDEDWVIETKVSAPLDHRYQQAGLQYFQDDGTYVKLDVVADNAPGTDPALRVELRSEIDDVPQAPTPGIQPAPDNPDDEWWLRLAKEGDVFTGWVSVDGETWIEVPEPVTNDAVTDGAYGLLHQGRTQESPVTVGFDHFHVGSGEQAPEPAATLDPAGPDGGNGWYVTPVTVTLTADDTAADIEYRIGDVDWTAYTEPVTLSDDGVHSVEYRASNAAGTSDVASVEVSVDRTSPEAEASLAGDRNDDGAYLGSAELGIVATDAVSGVATVEYRLGDGEWTAYTEAVGFGEPGEYQVSYRASDEAGGVSEVGSLELTVVAVACPEPDERVTVIVSGVDSGVPNRAIADGCTVNDLILDEQEWPDHGAFVRHVREVTDELVADGVIDARERGAIIRTAARSEVGR